MKATVIISDTISQGALSPCVHMLCAQEFPADQYEVLLPDLGLLSTEDGAILAGLEKEYPQFRILRDASGSRAARIDAAARASRGELLLFIESHCLPSRRWVARYVERFARGDARAVLGTFTTVPTRSAVGNAEENFRVVVNRRFDVLGLRPHYLDFHNMAITREAFLQTGGLARELPIFCEFDLGARLHRDGIPILPLPDNDVWHYNDASLRNYSRIVEGQGRDRMRVYLLRGPEFAQRYFPNRRFFGALPLLRVLRWPLIALATLLMLVTGTAFKAANALRLRRLSDAFFRSFATNSHRRGMLRGLGDRV